MDDSKKDDLKIHCPFDAVCYIADDRRERPAFLLRDKGRYICLALYHYQVDRGDDEDAVDCLVPLFADQYLARRKAGE